MDDGNGFERFMLEQLPHQLARSVIIIIIYLYLLPLRGFLGPASVELRGVTLLSGGVCIDDGCERVPCRRRKGG